jgi:hypothetical protein
MSAIFSVFLWYRQINDIYTIQVETMGLGVTLVTERCDMVQKGCMKDTCCNVLEARVRNPLRAFQLNVIVLKNELLLSRCHCTTRAETGHPLLPGIMTHAYFGKGVGLDHMSEKQGVLSSMQMKIALHPAKMTRQKPDTRMPSQATHSALPKVWKAASLTTLGIGCFNSKGEITEFKKVPP